MIKITFLGTGSMIPTKQRNHSAVLLSYKDENILVDCGEGTQRQFRIAGLKPTKITKILITHWHGDHVLGLPGLVQTLGTSEFNGKIEIYGPKGSKRYFKNMCEGIAMICRIDVEIHEIEKAGKFLDTKDFSIEAYYLEHGIETLGYRFIEKDRRNIDVDYIKKFGLQKHPILKQLQQGKDIEWQGKKIKAENATKITEGKVIAFVADTTICDNAVKVAKEADIAICESTHLEKDKSEEYMHMTAKEAGEVAKKAKAKKLILTHFSQRYGRVDDLVKEAKHVFKHETIAAEDFLEIIV
ncbi:ribonuclease Z [Candidatus Woesearchaeota archaeon]|nr:ribonuclease Z [Candidatus Woesearchaeota archaeon]